jgi:predicted component of type VI protein secretion system
MTHFKELNFDKKNSAVEFTNIFTEYWPIIKHINKRRAAIFLEIVPLAYCIRKSYKQIAKAMTLVLEIPIQIKSNYERHPIQAKKKSSLGFAKLGLNLITTGYLNDRHQDITIEIGPLQSDRFSNFQSDGYDRKILKTLVDMLFPANCKVSTKYIFNDVDVSFILGGITNKSKRFLGINTFLSKQ